MDGRAGHDASPLLLRAGLLLALAHAPAGSSPQPTYGRRDNFEGYLNRLPDGLREQRPERCLFVGAQSNEQRAELHSVTWPYSSPTRARAMRHGQTRVTHRSNRCGGPAWGSRSGRGGGRVPGRCRAGGSLPIPAHWGDRCPRGGERGRAGDLAGGSRWRVQPGGLPTGLLAMRAVLPCGSRPALRVLRPRMLRTVRAVRTRLRVCLLSVLHLAALSLLPVLGLYRVPGLLSGKPTVGSLAIREAKDVER